MTMSMMRTTGHEIEKTVKLVERGVSVYKENAKPAPGRFVVAISPPASLGCVQRPTNPSAWGNAWGEAQSIHGDGRDGSRVNQDSPLGEPPRCARRSSPLTLVRGGVNQRTLGEAAVCEVLLSHLPQHGEHRRLSGVGVGIGLGLGLGL